MTDEEKKQCKCVPHGICLRCGKMILEAHSKGYEHAIADLLKHIDGKKPSNRFDDVKKRVAVALSQAKEEAVREERERIRKEIDDWHKEIYDSLEGTTGDRYSLDYKHGSLRMITLVGRYLHSLQKEGEK